LNQNRNAVKQVPNSLKLDEIRWKFVNNIRDEASIVAIGHAPINSGNARAS